MAETKEKAKKLHTYYGRYSSVVEYEYRGCKYEVEYSNCWTYCCSPAWYQHKVEQEKIDEMLDNPKPVKTGEPTKSVEEQMDEIWEMMGW